MIPVRSSVLTLCLMGLVAGMSPLVAQPPAHRVNEGLLVLYDFGDAEGSQISDRSAVGDPLDLRIGKPTSVEWSKGSLAVNGPASIQSRAPAAKIIDAVKRTHALTIEAWISPANATQEGPARIVSISADPTNRNLTLGQEKNVFDVRLRTTRTSANGLPSAGSPRNSLRPRLTHVVYTRAKSGAVVIYLDGQQVEQKKVAGDLGNWNGNYRLILADEVNGGRAWQGEFHLVAVYDRALSVDEVQQNYDYGVESDPVKAAVAISPSAKMFRDRVAPLLAKNCLECHDSAIKKGGLDLSRKVAALAGGDSGPSLQPDDLLASHLWERIESGEMPEDRPPLLEDDKQAIKAWLEAGADWSIDIIDPANYLHDNNASEVWVQRLTVNEYIETVRSTLGVDIESEARELLPPDLRADGFSNTSYNLSVDLKHVDAYGKLAQTIVQRMDVAKFAKRFSKSRLLDADKMGDLIGAMGKWVLRGPLDQQEINVYRGIASTVTSAGGNFDEAVGFILEAMIQSPRFIYRIEDHRGNGGLRRIDQYELASRVSYIVWGGPPDQALMQAADKGELGNRQQLENHVRRMLKDPRAIRRSEQFIYEWLNLGRLNNIRPDEKRFPNWKSDLAADMQQETLAYFREVAWTQNRPLSDLLNAQLTFATPELANHYGLQPQGEGLTAYDLTAIDGRGGVLSHGSVLTVGGDEASMVSRGLFVLNDLLRGTINAPPPCVNTTPPPTKEGLTQRGIAEMRIADKTCGICHVRFEPLAFGLEKFDGVGAFHDRDEHGNQLRDDGEILFPGEAKAVAYESFRELADLLADSQRVQESLTWKVTQFSLGRPLVSADAPIVAEIHAAAQKEGGTYASLVTAIVLSDLVRKTRTERSE